jgi:hypothetical protein
MRRGCKRDGHVGTGGTVCLEGRECAVSFHDSLAFFQCNLVQFNSIARSVIAPRHPSPINLSQPSLFHAPDSQLRPRQFRNNPKYAPCIHRLTSYIPRQPSLSAFRIRTTHQCPTQSQHAMRWPCSMSALQTCRVRG